jgi:hypothetical protein
VLGCLAALSRFISRLGEKGLPLYRLLKKHERFSWTIEAQEAPYKLKASLAHAPILTPPQDSVDGVFWCTKHVHYTLVWI